MLCINSKCEGIFFFSFLFSDNVLFCVKLVSNVLNLECNSEYAPIRSSAEAGGVNEIENTSTSSINFTLGIPRSFSPSVIESKDIELSVSVSMFSVVAIVLETSSSDCDMVAYSWICQKQKVYRTTEGRETFAFGTG